MTRSAILLSLVLSLCACASAEIEVEADLYKEETIADRERKATREQQNQIEIAQSINRSKAVAASCGEKTKRVADDLVDVAVAYQALHGSLASRPVDKSKAKKDQYEVKQLKFEKAVDDAVMDVGKRADAAQLAFAHYIAVSLDPDPALAPQERTVKLFEANASYAASIDNLNAAMAAVINELQTGKTPFANMLREKPKQLLTGLDQIKSSDWNKDQSATEAIDAIAAKVLALSRAIDDLSPECANVPPSVPADLIAAANQLKDQTISGVEISKSLSDVALGLRTLTGPLELGPGARADIRDLAVNQTFYLSQVDRLQDPADPAWREVLNPANAENWETVFGRTRFYAEGNADVIVVRDRPGHYRIQRGVNNPAALIQGQLEISRSVASAATAVLGAVSGVNVPLVPDKKDSSLGPVAVASGQGGTGSLSGEAARVGEAQRVRNAARTTMAAELQTMIRELGALSDPEINDKTRRDEIYARIAPVLKAYADLLKFTGEVK